MAGEIEIIEGCAECRRHRLVCSNKRPRCTRCSKLGLSCTFDTTGEEALYAKVAQLHQGHYEEMASDDETEVEESEYDEDDVEAEISSQHLYHQDVVPAYSRQNQYQIPDYISPTPDIFRKNPFLHENFNFFCDQTSKVLVVAPENIYTNNPFHQILPRTALHNDALVGAIVAFALLHKHAMLKLPEPTELINALITRGVQEIMRLLQSEETRDQDITLTLILLLGSFDIFGSAQGTRTWQYHVEGAKKILINRKMSLKRVEGEFAKSPGDKKGLLLSQNRESDKYYFYLRWCAYLDVIAHLSTPLIPEEALLKRKLFYSEDEEKVFDSSSHSESSISGIDLLLGMNLRFIPVFDSLVGLITQVNLALQNAPMKTAAMVPPELIAQGVSLKTRLDAIFVSTEPERFVSEKQYQILFATNSIFYFGALLSLYRRVFYIPREVEQVQELCDSIRYETETHLPAGSAAEFCSMFGIFNASAECCRPETRAFFNARLSYLASLGNKNAVSALNVLHKIWKTNENWTDAAAEMDSSMTFA